jgi:hypothetical protein
MRGNSIVVSSMNRGWLALVVGLMAHSARWQGSAPATDSVTKGPPDGAFTYTLVADSSGDVKAAINKTVDGMNFITRPIARGRLAKVNPVPHRVRVVLGKDTVSAAFDEGNPVVTPVSGQVVAWSNPLTHETNQAHAAVAGDTVRQTIVAGDGQRENAFIFTDGGTRLHLVVTVTSHRLPRPLTYELLFRREDQS